MNAGRDHTANDAIRSEVMPINRKWPIKAVVNAVRGLRLRSRERVTFEYVLLGGVTDQPQHAAEVAGLVRGTGLPGKVNLIAWNPGPGIAYRTPDAEAVDRFRRALGDEGIPVYLRRPRGRDIYAVSAPIVVEAAQRVVNGLAKATGVVAAGQAFDARDFLKSLCPEHVSFEIQSDG